MSTLYLPSAPPPTPSTETSVSVSVSRQSDPYYGHEQISRVCAKFITHLFACPRATPVLLWFDYEAPVSHRLGSIARIAPLSDVWSPATKGPFSNRTGLVESSIIRFGLHGMQRPRGRWPIPDLHPPSTNKLTPPPPAIPFPHLPVPRH